MKKIMIEVYVPVLGKSYDVVIPTELKVGEICLLISNMIEEMSEMSYRKDDAILCDDRGHMLDNNEYIYEYNVKNADQLIIM